MDCNFEPWFHYNNANNKEKCIISTSKCSFSKDLHFINWKFSSITFSFRAIIKNKFVLLSAIIWIKSLYILFQPCSKALYEKMINYKVVYLDDIFPYTDLRFLIRRFVAELLPINSFIILFSGCAPSGYSISVEGTAGVISIKPLYTDHMR